MRLRFLGLMITRIVCDGHPLLFPQQHPYRPESFDSDPGKMTWRERSELSTNDVDYSYSRQIVEVPRYIVGM